MYRMIKRITAFFLSWKFFIVAITLILAPLFKDNFVFLPAEHGFRTQIQSSPLIRMFANFDGTSYLELARNGYSASELGYFPFYPILIGFFSGFTKMLFNHRYYVVTGQIISNASFFISLLIFYQIAKFDKQLKLFPLLMTIVLLYPTSFFFGATYNDALFLLLASLTILCSRKKWWLLAGISGALATITRLNGLALFFLIIVEYLLQKNDDSKFMQNLDYRKWFAAVKKTFSIKNVVKDRIYWALFIPGAFLGYLWYIQNKFGSFLLLFTSMSAWGQDKIIFPLQTVWRYIKIIVLYPTFQLNYWVAVLELISVVLYVFILWYSLKKIRFSYWIFMLISFLIPSLTGTFQGMPRYALHLYPFFLSLAILLNNSSIRIKILYFLVNSVLLVILLGMFTHGYFVA